MKHTCIVLNARNATLSLSSNEGIIDGGVTISEFKGEKLSADEMKEIDELDQEKHSLWYHDFQWNGNPDGIGDYVATPDKW